ncbi:hypothetical protein QZH41_018435 [Actinostola sp. cb2023]|nr:hypothetical protein QZH41_018435 [Actinostola sp. cb2023]
MACATLKRSYEFDPLLSPQHQPSSKRRRCIPISAPSSSPSSSTKDSPFTEVTPRVTQEQYDAFVKFNYDQVQRRFEKTTPTCE